MDSLPAERKALLFSAGGARLAMRVSNVREVVAVAPDGGEVRARGEPVATAFVSTVLGLPGGPAPYAILTQGSPPAALRVEALHGIVDPGSWISRRPSSSSFQRGPRCRSRRRSRARWW